MTGPDARTTVVGIIGDPIAHSLSPRMHNEAFKAAGLNWVYLAWRVRPPDLAAAVRGLATLGCAGVNVTVPHKEAVVALLDDIDEEAARIGAVNTLRMREGRTRGFNTDADGLMDALTQDGGARIAGSRCLVVGAGGGGRAAAFGLARSGAAQVTILNRTTARAETLARQVREAVASCEMRTGTLDRGGVEEAAEDAGIIVHATSTTMSSAMGGSGGRAPWLEALRGRLRRGMTVLDMVYTPVWTELLTAAREAGATPVAGTSMLVHQGARAFALWTGRPAPLDVMKRALDAEVPHRR